MSDPLPTPAKASIFPPTDWALVLSAGTGEPGAHEATARIFELYWEPVQRVIQLTWPSKTADEALDATHDFFKLRLEKHDIKDLDPEKGKFQNWLKIRVKRFLLEAHRSTEREREQLSLDASLGEDAWAQQPRTALDPCLLLEQELALKILEVALANLEAEHALRGTAEIVRQAYDLGLLSKDRDENVGTNAELEQLWGLTPGSLKVRIYTMRERLDTLICLELGVPPDDASARKRELAWLYQAIALKEEQPSAKVKALRSRSLTEP